MTPLEHRKFDLHSQTDAFNQRVEQAETWIHSVFSRFDEPCLNYSGGKDSLVLLHLVTCACGYDDVDVYHFDNGLLKVPGSDDFVRESVSRLGGNLFHRSSEAANSEEMLTEVGHGYSGFWGWYSRLQKRREWDVRLLGIRSDESRERRDRFDSDGSAPPINWHEQYTAAAPIHHFTARDVWAYIVSNDLQYHEIYDKQGELYGGMESRGNRLVTLYDSEFDSLGARTISQFVYPSETNELKRIEQDTESE